MNSGYFSYYFDPTFLILIPALLVGIWAQSKVNRTYDKYSKVQSRNGYTGEEIARMMLNEAGLFDVTIEIVNKRLGDHYDPRHRILRLSHDIYYGKTIAAAGIAAHEVGHAIQHKERYSPLAFRNSIFPAVNISSSLSWVILFAGLIFSIKPLVYFGIGLFSIVVICQLVTLPVEFNASTRALRVLSGNNILYEDEAKGAANVLDAAAMTYVAATLMAISQLIRLIAISKRND
jgi:Zn-dependent membrane protease YugP